jgi:hypothetical protein
MIPLLHVQLLNHPIRPYEFLDFPGPFGDQLMRAAAPAPFGPVATHAQDLVTRREALLLEPAVKVGPRESEFPAMLSTITVNMVNRQERNASLPTANAFRAAVPSENLLLEPPRPSLMSPLVFRHAGRASYAH